MFNMDFTLFRRYTVLAGLMSFVVTAHCQNYRPSDSDCKKYCFVDCENYKENKDTFTIWTWGLRARTNNESEYTDCITANILCHCQTRFNWKNPMMILCMVSIGILAVVLVYRIHRRCKIYHKNGLIYSGRVPHPMASSVNTITNSNFTGGGQTNNCYQTFEVSPPTDAPPEYLPPPSYFELAIQDKPKSVSSTK